MAMQYIDSLDDVNNDFLDAGCGMGYYGELLARHYPKMRYRAFDLSQSVIDEAKRAWPERQHAFWVQDAKTFDYSTSDIVLASSLLETMDDWIEGAKALCTAKDIIILHRIRIHDGLTERGWSTNCHGPYYWLHNEGELKKFFMDYGFECIYRNLWPEYEKHSFNMATYILRKIFRPQIT